MHVDLPVHQAAANQKLFNRCNGLVLQNQMPVRHVKHFKQSVAVNRPLDDSGVEGVALEVVHAVHVKLRRNKLVQKTFGMPAFKNGDGLV